MRCERKCRSDATQLAATAYRCEEEGKERRPVQAKERAGTTSCTEPKASNGPGRYEGNRRKMEHRKKEAQEKLDRSERTMCIGVKMERIEAHHAVLPYAPRPFFCTNCLISAFTRCPLLQRPGQCKCRVEEWWGPFLAGLVYLRTSVGFFASQARATKS